MSGINSSRSSDARSWCHDMQTLSTLLGLCDRSPMDAPTKGLTIMWSIGGYMMLDQTSYLTNTLIAGDLRRRGVMIWHNQSRSTLIKTLAWCQRMRKNTFHGYLTQNFRKKIHLKMSSSNHIHRYYKLTRDPLRYLFVKLKWIRLHWSRNTNRGFSLVDSLHLMVMFHNKFL